MCLCSFLRSGLCPEPYPVATAEFLNVALGFINWVSMAARFGFTSKIQFPKIKSRSYQLTRMILSDFWNCTTCKN
jgi:hypothetical protein